MTMRTRIWIRTKSVRIHNSGFKFLVCEDSCRLFPGVRDRGEHQVGGAGPPGDQAGPGQDARHLRQEQVGEHEQVSQAKDLTAQNIMEQCVGSETCFFSDQD